MFGLCLFLFGSANQSFGTQFLVYPEAVVLIACPEFGPDNFHQLSQSAIVLPKLCAGNSGSCLSLDHFLKPFLTLGDIVQNLQIEVQGARRPSALWGPHYW